LIPPTLTPFPTVAPADNPVAMPHVALWDYAPKAVQTWHMANPNLLLLIQGVLVLGIVIFGIFMVVWFIRGLSNETPGGEE
jgi:hypothetical protein